MKLQKFKENNRNQKGIIIFTIACVLLITGVFLYKTFASFQVIKNEDLINGDVNDPGDIYFAFYKDNKIQKDMPQKEDGYILDEENSYCGVTGGTDPKLKVTLNPDNWSIVVEGVTTSRTKCNLYFIKGAYILGKGIPTVTEGNGLYEVKHDGVSGTIKDEGFNQTEYRYAGSDPDNYIKFNDEDWRIIGLVNVMTSEETVEQRVKIIRKDSIGELTWNTESENNWVNASLKTLLNEGNYYKRTEEFSDTGLNEKSKVMIEEVIWNLGGNDSSVLTVSEFYNLERGTKIYNGNQTTWKGRVALMYPSDYGYSVGGITREECLKLNKEGSGWGSESECDENAWIVKDENNYLTIMAQSNPKGNLFIIFQKHLTGGFPVDWKQQVLPVLYLKTSVKIKDGKGIESNPYNLSVTL